MPQGGAGKCPAAMQPQLNVPGKDGIYRDGMGKLYKLDTAGRRYSVDATRARVFKYANGRVTSRPPELDNTAWDQMSKKTRAANTRRRQTYDTLVEEPADG